MITKNIPMISLKTIFFLSAVNALFLVLAPAFDIHAPLSYLYVGDLFGDFLKVVLSYPGASSISINSHLGLFATLSDYISNNPYQGVDGLAAGSFTHFHLPPLSTAISLGSLCLMRYISPQLDFYLMLIVIVLAIYGIARKVGSNKQAVFVWVLCFLISYPFLFLLQRGNFFSAATSLLVIYYLLFLRSQKNIVTAIFLLSLAVNIRPNAAIFILALFLVKERALIKHVIFFGLFSLLVFFISAIVSEIVYPAYSVAHFIVGLKIYHKFYVAGNKGIDYNSSLYALFYYIAGYKKLFEFICLAVAVLIVLIAIILHQKKLTAPSVFVLLLCIAYMVGTPVFGDYHLLVFFAPLLFLALEQGEKTTRLVRCQGPHSLSVITFFLSCFLLSPKNYVMSHHISVVVLLNPILSVLSVLFIVFYSVAHSRKTNRAIEFATQP